MAFESSSPLPRCAYVVETQRGGSLSSRRCSRPACKRVAVCTLTYVYRDSTAVLGPLAAYVEPHCYDLCGAHADRLTAPRGWDIVRLPLAPSQEAAADDLEALANAVREAAAPSSDTDRARPPRLAGIAGNWQRPDPGAPRPGTRSRSTGNVAGCGNRAAAPLAA